MSESKNKYLTKEDLKLNDNIKFDSKGGAILGVLEGPVADFMHPTRNGREYSEQLWENVLKNPIVKEQFENGGIPGELDHPKDRDEVCSEKIAVLMPEPPVKKNGEYWGKFDILDTPCGRIVYTLAKAGYRLGVSSRGNGDFDEYTGEVDPDSYDFTCFDVVLLPAVKNARMNLVTESLDKSNKQTTFRKLLKEELDRSSSQEREIMLKTLTNLKENLDNPQSIDNFKKNNPTFNKDFNFDKYGKYFDDNGKLIDKQGYEQAVKNQSSSQPNSQQQVQKQTTTQQTTTQQLTTQQPNNIQQNNNQTNNQLKEDIELIKSKFGVNDIIAESYLRTMNKETLKTLRETKELKEDNHHFKCCLCGKEVDGWGNNPYPITEDGGCCDECNRDKVIPARIKLAYSKKRGIKEDKEIPDVKIDDDSLDIKNIKLSLKGEEGETLEDKLKEVLNTFLDKEGLELDGKDDEEKTFIEIFKSIFPNIDYTSEEVEDNIAAKDIGATDGKDDEEDNNEELLNQLQESLKQNKALKDTIKQLQMSKAAGNTRVSKLEEELDKYKIIASNAGKKALKVSTTNSKQLQEKLNTLDSTLQSTKDELNVQKISSNIMEKSFVKLTEEKKKLEEQLSNYSNKLKDLNNQLNICNNKYNSSKKLVEQYKEFANKIADKYIESKAIALGIKSSDIKNRLSESYTLEDVDRVSKELQEYSLNISNLPFALSNNSNSNKKVRVREDFSRDPLNHINNQYDDTVDDYLLDLAGLKNVK